MYMHALTFQYCSICREAYPSCEVCTVTLVYNVTKLMHLDKER